MGETEFVKNLSLKPLQAWCRLKNAFYCLCLFKIWPEMKKIVCNLCPRTPSLKQFFVWWMKVRAVYRTSIQRISAANTGQAISQDPRIYCHPCTWPARIKSSCGAFFSSMILHCKKGLAVFPSPAGMSLIKLFLGGNNLVFPAQREFHQWHPGWGRENG